MRLCRLSVAVAAALLLAGCKEEACICPSLKEVQAPFSSADKSAFARPDKMYYPETWFHLIGGNVDKEGITKDLEAIKAAGISGIQLFHGSGDSWPDIKEPVQCLSEKWEDLIHYTAKEADRLGLRFTMQNCPGWSMSGGPWIKPENAMRELVWTRTDTKGGELKMNLPKSLKPSEESWRDYRDLFVIAFPTPDGDTGAPAVPSSVSSDTDDAVWRSFLSGENASIRIPAVLPGQSHFIDVRYAKPQMIRSIVFSSIEHFDHAWCADPGVHVSVLSYQDDGKYATVLDSDMPMSSWQDDKDMTFALNESASRRFVILIANKHDMSLSKLQLLPAARKNSWEAEAAWTLRQIPYLSEHPEQSASAFIKPESILDITSSMKPDGTLEWNAPDGEWTILRIGHVNKGHKNSPAPQEGTGWECDKLSAEGADASFNGYIRKLAQGPAAGILSGMLLDSWECKTQTWTAAMEDEFKAFNGYELRQWLPALFGYVIADHETTARFLIDWRQCINHLFTDNFYGRMAADAKSEGLNIQFETAAGDIFPADILEYYKYADVPMSEFWNHPTHDNYVGSYNFKPVRMTTSAAHVYGKTRHSAEALTSFKLTWDEHFDYLKDIANQYFVRGVTHAVFHTYTHNPNADTMVPGTSFGRAIGTPFLRGQTWWEHMPEFTSYFARLSYMLERGRPVADVLWYLGDGSMHKPDEEYSFPQGYSFDYCNQDVLLNRLSVVNGRLVIPEGQSWAIMWLPDTHHMLPATAAKLRELVEAGAVIVGEAPKNIGTLVSGDDVPAANGVSASSYKDDIAALWPSEARGFNRLGKGMVISGMYLQEALDVVLLAPDVLISSYWGGPDPQWLHRKTMGADWYFITAPRDMPFTGTLDFANRGSVSIWDPVTGEITPVDAVQKDGRTSIHLDLPYAGSCFVVFDHTTRPKPVAPVDEKELCTVDGEWTLSFPEGWGAPASVQLGQLTAWKDIDMPEAEGKAFSGTATYTKTVHMGKIDPKATYKLYLGDVEEIAKVFVNGKEISTLWCEPFCADITKALHKGDNQLKIEVTSTWFNRLVYDANQPESQRKTWVIAGPVAKEPLRPSGLIGPVHLTVSK